MNRYINAIFMVLVAVGGTAVAALADNHLSQPEAVNIVIAGLGAAVVFTAPNMPGAMYVKWSLAAMTAAATLLATFIGTGGVLTVTVSEWIQIGLAALGALGVVIVPNAPVKAVPVTGAITP